ncbi:hypothetical protein [Streptomyces sp. NPDC014894]
MTEAEIEALARRLAELLPGYLLHREPEPTPPPAAGAQAGEGALPV